MKLWVNKSKIDVLCVLTFNFQFHTRLLIFCWICRLNVTRKSWRFSSLLFMTSAVKRQQNIWPPSVFVTLETWVFLCHRCDYITPWTLHRSQSEFCNFWRNTYAPPFWQDSIQVQQMVCSRRMLRSRAQETGIWSRSLWWME